MSPPPLALVKQQTRAWLDAFVVGLNLCPFAKPVLAADTLRLAIAAGSDTEQLARSFLQELDLLQQSAESEIATTLLIVPEGLALFDDYLDFVELANQMIEQVGLLGTVQLATFHPDYCFEGEPADGVSHYTNRSPYPMLHLLREEMVEAAIAAHPDADDVPARNIERLEALGRDQVLALWAQLAEPH